MAVFKEDYIEIMESMDQNRSLLKVVKLLDQILSQFFFFFLILAVYRTYQKNFLVKLSKPVLHSQTFSFNCF